MLRALGREAQFSDPHRLALDPGVSAYEWLSVGSSHEATRKPVLQLSSTKYLCSQLRPGRMQAPKGDTVAGLLAPKGDIVAGLGNTSWNLNILCKYLEVKENQRFPQRLLSPKNWNPKTNNL